MRVIGKNTFYHGDNLAVMKDFADESIDTIITDPPYALEFMGRDWDKVLPSIEVWRECLRVAKPGAILLAFGGTRTFHRLTCNIEDAGWEIRDCIMWVYGSGFPKSLDVSKAIDMATGVKRETVGVDKNSAKRGSTTFHGAEYKGGYTTKAEGERILTAPATEAAKQWDGWGTALKPAAEIIVWATKPYDLQAISGILAHKIKEAVCQLPSYVRGVKKNLKSSLSECVGDVDSALWLAVEKCNTPDDLYDLMVMSQSEWETIIVLNTVWSWLNILAAISKHMNAFTTEMATELTTNLKILNCSPSPITPEYIIEGLTSPHGIESNALIAGSVFLVVKMKLNDILKRIAPGNVIEIIPNLTLITVAMKPLEGTYAQNALKHGVAGLNIDGGRIGTEQRHYKGSGAQPHKLNAHSRGDTGIGYMDGRGKDNEYTVTGRWPANLILDGSDEVLAGFPQSSNGSAARFFYCAKASKAERGEGNNHPTVKPLALMEYLCTLTKTPTGGIVLDPFMGSGTTLIACRNTDRSGIGIEQSEHDYNIAIERNRNMKPEQVGIF